MMRQRCKRVGFKRREEVRTELGKGGEMEGDEKKEGVEEFFQLLNRAAEEGRWMHNTSKLSAPWLISLSSEAPYLKIRLVRILNEQIPFHYRIIISAYPPYLAAALPSCLCMSLCLMPTSKRDSVFS